MRVLLKWVMFSFLALLLLYALVPPTLLIVDLIGNATGWYRYRIEDHMCDDQRGCETRHSKPLKTSH